MFDRTKVLESDFATRLVRSKVRQMAYRAGLSAADQEDLGQELLLRLGRALKDYDPRVPDPEPFIRTVINRAAAMILRERIARKRNGGLLVRLDDLELELPDEQQQTERERQELADDLSHSVAQTCALLDIDLRDVAERLRHHKPAQVARDLGLPLSTLYRRIQRLKHAFERAGLRKYL